MNRSEIAESVELLRRIHQRGIAIVYVEHVMEAVMGLSDRIQVLEHGETIAVGTPDAITRDPRVIEAYLGRGPGVSDMSSSGAART